MKIRFISFFLTVILLFPTFSEVSVYLSGHEHEKCNKDGIHFHENLSNCDICLINNVYNEDYLITQISLIESDFITSNFNYNLYDFSGNFHLSPLSRGPPENIS